MSLSEEKTFGALDRALHISLKKALSQNTLGNMRRVRNYCTIRNSTYHKRIRSYLKSSRCESAYGDEGRGLLANSYDQASYQEEKSTNNSNEDPSFLTKAGRVLLASLKAHAECYNPALALDPQFPPSTEMITSAGYSSSIWNQYAQ